MTFGIVYRSGPVEVGQHTGEVAALYAQADALRPAGRPGRGDSIYAAPSLFGVSRWVRGNDLVRSDTTTRELRVSRDNVYVYSVDAWERATSGFGDFTAQVTDFWNSGIPLSEWNKAASLRNLDPRQWEVLVPAGAVQSARPVSNRRVIASVPADDWTRRELMKVLEPARYLRGTIW